MIREPSKPVPPWVLLTSRTFTQDRFENIVPANIVKTKKTFFLTVILTDRHRAAPHITLSSGMSTHSAYGHARPPHPRQCAVLVHAGGCWFPGRFWRWPVAVYARSRVTAAHSVPVCTVETAQGRAHWARPCASGFVRMCWAWRFVWHWRGRALRACMLHARCAHACNSNAAGANCRHFLGPQNDPRHEYANWSDV